MTRNGRFWCMSLILLAAAAGFYCLPHGRDVPLPQPLAALPLSFGQWYGVDAPVEEPVVRELAVDDYLSRIYRGESSEPIGLFVAYYKSQRTDEAIHSPQHCLPGSGWQPVKVGRVGLRTGQGEPANVNEDVFQKGLEQQVVLYWYQSHGRIIASEYQAKIALVADAIHLHRTDSALVRINMPITGAESEGRAVSFATAVLDKLDGIIPK